MPKFQVVVNKCKVCSKTVYPMEELIADESHYHKPCFKCSQCKRTLSTGTYASLDGAIFCKPHFLQLFKQKGNYEEGFGKERYKNKWGGVHVEKAPSGQSVIVNGAAPPTNGTAPEDKENVPDCDVADSSAPTNGHSARSVRGSTPDSSEDGIIEESALSLQEKKSKLYESSHKEIPKTAAPSKAAPGKLAKWQPKSFDESTTSSRLKPAPKKLNINWSAQASIKRDEPKSTDDQPEWVRKVRDRNLKFGELGSVKTKFETGDVGKKEFKSEAVKDEVDAVVKSVSGVTSQNKSRFETREERQYDTTKRQELEQLAFARSQPQVEKQEEVFEERETEENSRYKELEQFRRVASTKDSKNKFERGPFSNTEKKEQEARKEVQSFHGKGLARNTKEMYEKGDYSKQEYVSPVKQEITTIHADTLSKREMYESGGNKDISYESETKRELETLQTETSSTKSKFESGELVKTEFEATADKEDLESLRVAAAAADAKKKYESGELLKRDFDSETRKEVATLKTDAQSTKSKYESGELVRTEFDSETKEELSTIKSDARTKKDKYESGDVEHVQYDSEVKKEVESMRGQVEASNILDKYQREVEEGNKVVTSKPVTIERSKPEDYVTRDDDEFLRVQSSANGSSELSSPEYEEAEDVSSQIDEYDDLNDYEYVSMPAPNKMTNIEERFKKEEVEKPEVIVNKINIPTFEKQIDSDEDMTDAPSELEAEEMRKELWSTKASDVKSKFETNNQPEMEYKGTPNQIDLRAEVNGFED